jgi:hypothetical protein
MEKPAICGAAAAIRTYMGGDEDTPYGRGKRVKTSKTVALKMTSLRNRRGGPEPQEIWLVRGDATQTSSDEEILGKLREFSENREVLIVHELFDDFATGEDVADIVSSVQKSLKCVFGNTFVPRSVPDKACTVACPLSVEADLEEGRHQLATQPMQDPMPKRRRKGKKIESVYVNCGQGPSDELSGQLTISGSAIFTHDQLPSHWYHGKPQALESVVFEAKGRKATGDVCSIDCGSPASFSFDSPVHAIALNLQIDFGSGCVYDVRKQETSNWRNVIVGIPGSLQLEAQGSFSVRMGVFRSSDLQMSYTFDFINLSNGNSGQVHITPEDLTSVIMGDSLESK